MKQNFERCATETAGAATRVVASGDCSEVVTQEVMPVGHERTGGT